MCSPTLRTHVVTSLVLGSTLALALSSVACSSSSDGPAAQGAGGDVGAKAGATSAGGSTTGASPGSGGAGAGGVGRGGAAAAGSPGSGGASASGSGGTGSGAGGSGYAGSTGVPDSCVPEDLTAPPNVPAVIHAPAGTTVIHHFHAAGTQNYKCTATAGAADAGTTYAWVFIAPEADLIDDCSRHVGTHFAGSGGATTPRWQITADGSYVQGVKVQASPVAGAIPELLLVATESTAGSFADVTYVQRLETAGGAAPAAAGCTSSNVGEVKKSGYSAEYYFYAGGVDGGAH